MTRRPPLRRTPPPTDEVGAAPTAESADAVMDLDDFGNTAVPARGRPGLPAEVASTFGEPDTATVVAGAGEGMLPLLTPAQAARLLAVRESWLRRRATARAVPCTFLGKHLRFSLADIRAIAAAAAQSTTTRSAARSMRRRREQGR